VLSVARQTAEARSGAARSREEHVDALRGALAIVFLLCAPVLLVADVMFLAVQSKSFAVDFHNLYWPAARNVLHGHSPYTSPTLDNVAGGKSFVYPATAALLVTPFGLLPHGLAGVLATTSLIGGIFVALRLVGVRDWRCYGAAFLWPPVTSGIQTANLSLAIVLGLALLWRFRDRLPIAALTAAALISLKLFLWPVLVWLVATRRYAAGAWAVVVGIPMTFGAWAVLGFAGLSDYPRMVHVLQTHFEGGSYTPFVFLTRLGAPTEWARGGGYVIGTCAVVALLFAARRRRSDKAAFAWAVAATLLFSPIVWLHFFALFLVPLAILRPTFSFSWLPPVLLWGSTVNAGPSASKVALPFLVFGALFAFALGRRPGRPFRLRPVQASSSG